MEPPAASPEAGEEPERIKKCSGLAFSEYLRSHSGWRVLQDVPQESCQGLQHRWEAQWQEVLETVPSPPMMWESPELTETAPWEDAKAFLASFEQVAKACQWPRGEWALRLQPALSGEAKQAFSNLEAGDREDYGKVKAAILREDAIKMEVQRQHFRQFRYEELDEPRRIHSRLQELCRQWLRPERRSKEQILELLILEQFLASLPSELQGWIRAGGPDTCSQAVALAEDFLMSQQRAERQRWQEPLPEMTKISPEAEKTSTVVPKKVQKGAKQNRSRENGPLDSGDQRFRDPSSLVSPPDDLEIVENDLTEVPVDFRETEVSRHVVEPTLAPPGQQTMFWQVMQEEDGDAESLEGLLVPKPELSSRPEEAEEEMFIPFSAASERRLGQDSGDERRSWLKREIAREAKTGTSAGLSPWVLPTTLAETQEQRCESQGKEGKKPVVGEKEPGVRVESLTAGGRRTSVLLHSQAEKLRLSSKYGRRSCHRPGLEASCLKKDPAACRMWWGDLRQQAEPKEGKAFKCPGCGKYFSQRHNLRRHQRIHTGEKPHVCPDCGRSFTRPDGLLSHQRKHFHVKPFECLECGKNFSYKCNLSKHQRVHVREVVL